MIKTSQYCFDISIGKPDSSRGMVSDFLKESDLGGFQLLLMSGPAVPIFEITLRLDNKEIASCFRQGSIVTIKFGADEQNIKSYDCVIGSINTSEGLPEENVDVISFEACITDKSTKYLMNTDSLAKQGTSLEVLKVLSKEFFGTELVTDIESVKETPMIWRQDTMFNNLYLASIWLHMNIEPDVPLMYIDEELKLHVLSYENLKQGPVKVTFTANKPQQGENQIHFYNIFNPQSHKASINAIATNQVACVREAESGKVKIEFPESSKPEIASTTENEGAGYGNTIKHNLLESLNVSKGYKKAYHYNRNKLNQLSSISGFVEVPGLYFGVNIYDIVNVIGVTECNSGRYMVEDIIYTFGHGTPPFTTIYLTRDNINRVEKYVKKEDLKNAYMNFLSEIKKFYTMVRNLRILVQKCRYIVDGSLFRDLKKFTHQLKYNLLRSFTVCGIPLDFNSTNDLVNSIRSIGMTILNNIVKTYLPAPFNTALLNYPGGVKTKEIVSKLLTQYAPDDVRLLIVEIQGLVFDITDGLGRVAKNASVAQKALIAKNTVNSDNISFTDTANGVVEVNIVEREVQELDNIETRINNILQEFLDNTSEVDIPLPLIDLTESQSLYTDEELRNLLANLVVTELSSRGYLDGVSNFKDILLGNDSLTFEQINTINQNTGLILYPRFWGNYIQPEELTDFYITEQFRDMYKTPDFTTLISAKKGQHIFVAFPTFEHNLKIFINSTLQDMEVIPDVDLHIRDKSGNIIRYNVYVSPNGYNSNSNILEVRA